MWLRRLELLGGVLGGVLGLAALGFALFAPLGEQCSGSSNLGQPDYLHFHQSGADAGAGEPIVRYHAVWRPLAWRRRLRRVS